MCAVPLDTVGCVGSREERRWMEKQNKAARQKRKKDEMARLRTLVGMFIWWKASGRV